MAQSSVFYNVFIKQQDSKTYQIKTFNFLAIRLCKFEQIESICISYNFLPIKPVYTLITFKWFLPTGTARITLSLKDIYDQKLIATFFTLQMLSNVSFL